MKKYSDVVSEWLQELGYTHCFFLSGGYIMHLLDSVRERFTCIPVVHEVAAGIGAEYFNEVGLGGKAFVLVTAGPGLTNLITAVAGAFLESRELLVIGGQVKVADLSRGQVRQRGIQEIDGVALASPVCERAARIEAPLGRAAFSALVQSRSNGRHGPVYVEFPLDVQGMQVAEEEFSSSSTGCAPVFETPSATVLEDIRLRLMNAKRPVVLIGSGIHRETADRLRTPLAAMGIPLMLTWNAADRLGADAPLYFGRPNTWGQRYANVLLQQADLVLALGSRLSVQQTGFAWQHFVPAGEIVQVDCDPAELRKAHPSIAVGVCADANAFLVWLCSVDWPACVEWVDFCNQVKRGLPLVEGVNRTAHGFLCPYKFVHELSRLATAADIVIPCSSGSAFTVMMQAFEQKAGQRIVTNKGLAAMGYGLPGAIGAAFAGKGRRTILVDGDGGILQNIQELGTVTAHHLPLKMFLFENNGYASIRMTQQSYFGGRSIGCDPSSGLGLPCWETLFAAYDIPVLDCRPGFENDSLFIDAFEHTGPAAFLVRIDPQQTYFPKITSRLAGNGSMESNPLHLMSPDLDEATAASVFRYLQPGKGLGKA